VEWKEEGDPDWDVGELLVGHPQQGGIVLEHSAAKRACGERRMQTEKSESPEQSVCPPI